MSHVRTPIKHFNTEQSFLSSVLELLIKVSVIKGTLWYLVHGRLSGRIAISTETAFKDIEDNRGQYTLSIFRHIFQSRKRGIKKHFLITSKTRTISKRTPNKYNIYFGNLLIPFSLRGFGEVVHNTWLSTISVDPVFVGFRGWTIPRVHILIPNPRRSRRPRV